MDEISSEPYLNSSDIGVSCKNGVVTLGGKVDAYYKKMAAENAAKRVAGVKVVAENIEVGLASISNRTDTDIAEAILHALKWHPAIQQEKIKVQVENGYVRLTGEVEWDFQRRNIQQSIEQITGVRSVANLITVVPSVLPSDISRKITAAFQRSASIDSNKISVEVLGSKVILKGQVRSFAEKNDAERVAWMSPGVSQVDSRLEISVPEYAYQD